MFPDRAPIWISVTALAIVLTVVSVRPLPGSAGGLSFGGQQKPPQSWVAQDNCAVCHRGLNDQRLNAPAALFSDDIHREKGFGCAACHGGDASREGVDAMDPRRGTSASPGANGFPNSARAATLTQTLCAATTPRFAWINSPNTRRRCTAVASPNTMTPRSQPAQVVTRRTRSGRHRTRSRR